VIYFCKLRLITSKLKLDAIYSMIMTYQEFTRQFKLQTETLSYTRQINLAIEICKKLFFDYQQFSELNKWGDSDLVFDTIRFIDDNRNSKVDEDLIRDKIKQIEAITPDTEDFGHASYALNCCVSICVTLEFLINHKAEHIYTIGTCLTDTIDFKIQEDCDLRDDEIDRNSEMIEARKYLLKMS
jgi:uncharacterized protein YjaG (DUF416 family)